MDENDHDQVTKTVCTNVCQDAYVNNPTSNSDIENDVLCGTTFLKTYLFLNNIMYSMVTEVVP